jgi:hypothetical protein
MNLNVEFNQVLKDNPEITISQYLKKLADNTKFTKDQIMVNLKDCLKGKKCCLFSCGANILEHKDKFHEIKKDKTFITCCIKSSIEYLHYDSDILVLFGSINGDYLKNSKIINPFILKQENFIYNHDSYELDNFKFENFDTNYWVINFLNYIGIKEIYLFGFYLADYIIHDLTNYNYYDDIVCEKFHAYDDSFVRIKEPGILFDNIYNEKLVQYCIINNILLYNVSKYGCLSNKITRINFESIFSNEKQIISSNIVYKDFLDELNDKVDIDFYYNRNCSKYSDSDTISLSEKTNRVYEHIIFEGLYCLKKVNKFDTKNEIQLNDFIKDIMSLFCYINECPYINIYVIFFFCHYLLMFNNLFNICFYKNFDEICKEKFYDNFCLKYKDEINIIEFDKIFLELNEQKYRAHKYFKLFVYLIYIKN